jgi:hypothetical protein
MPAACRRQPLAAYRQPTIPSHSIPLPATPTGKAVAVEVVEEFPEEPPPIQDELAERQRQTPSHRCLTQSLFVPPILQPHLAAYTADVQKAAWDVCREFQEHHPRGRRSVETWAKIIDNFAGTILRDPDSAKGLLDYYRTRDPTVIATEVKAGRRLPPNASPHEVCEFLYPPNKTPPRRPPTGPPKIDPALARLRAEDAEAEKHAYKGKSQLLKREAG